MKSLFSGRSSVFQLAALVIVALVLPALLPSNYFSGLVVLTAIFALLGLSVNLAYGYLGYMSFGHAAYFGLGAYSAALLAAAGVNFWWAVVLSLLPGLALGALVGFASVRISGAYFAITTLTVAEILRLVAENWVDVTNGPMGMIVQGPEIGWLQGVVEFQYYYLSIVLLAVGLAYIGMARLLRTTTGRAWVAIRESRDLAESIGIPTLGRRVENLAISGALGSLAGALLVPKVLVVSPEMLTPLYSATGILIVVLGGRGTLVGMVIGGAIFAWLPELLRPLGELRLAVFGLMLLVAVRLLPNGLASLLRRPGATPPVPQGAVAPAAGGPIGAGVAAVMSEGRTPVPLGQPVLHVSGLTKRFQGLTAVNDVGFEVREGEILGLMGSNGAGKSTCLGMLSGFIRPSAGTVRFLGQDVAGLPPHQLARRGLVRTFQQTTIFKDLSVFDNVRMGTQCRRPGHLLGNLLQTRSMRADEAASEAAVHAVLALVGLSARAAALAGAMSYGEQRLLSIAVALAASPRLLMLDEPAAGLNPSEAEQLGQMLMKLRDSGLTIVLVEHNVRLMMKICDRLVMLHHGDKITEGLPAEVRRHPEVIKAYFGAGAEVNHA